MSEISANDQTAPLYDITNPATIAHPYPAYELLREQHPAYWSPIMGSWLITRYSDVVAITRDQRVSSASSLTGNEAIKHLPPEVQAVVGPALQAMGSQLVFMDPPQHTRLRALLTRAFTPRAVEQMRPTIQAITNRLLDQALANNASELDIVQTLAYPLPVTVIAEMMGVPPEDHARFNKWADAFIGLGRTQNRQQLFGILVQSLGEMTAYLQPMIAELRGHSQPGLLSALLEAEVDGVRLSDQEVIMNTFLLLTAGHETTINLIANGTLALLQNPDQLTLLRQRPELLENAVEEFLRYESPVQWIARLATQDLEIAGQTAQAGQRISVGIGAANRDPRQFANADRLDITRQDNRQVAFGYGIHFCLGAALARLEGQVAFASLLQRLPDFQLATTEVEWQPNYAFRSLKALPVRISQ